MTDYEPRLTPEEIKAKKIEVVPCEPWELCDEFPRERVRRARVEE